MSLGTPGPFGPFIHVRSALQVSERRNELHTVCVGLLAGAAQSSGLQTMRLSNRLAGAVARSDRPCRSGGPMDHLGPSRGDSK
eukprot:428192-Prymnesium_polylepis.1